MKRFVVALVVFALAMPAVAQERVYDLRAGAWDRSVQLEQEGRLREARALLVRAWGNRPEGYEVSVRLAWLSLRLGDAGRAAREYRRARTLPGAGPEATRGLGSARAQQDTVRQRIDPELWGGYVGERLGDGRADGFAVFAVLPVQLSDQFRVRAAYRFSWLDLQGSSFGSTSAALTAVQGYGPGPGMGMGNGNGPGVDATVAGGAPSWHEHDAFLGIGFGGAWAWLDVLGMGLFPSDERAVPGQAAELRLGRRFGIGASEAALARQRGWNVQAAPQLFVWPADWLRLSAGPRFTFDDQGKPVSAEAAVALVTAPVEVYVSGHAGTQRWPVAPAIPLVLTTDQDLPLGVSAALMLPVARSFKIGISSEIEQLASRDVDGLYTSFAAGLRWSPRF